MFLIGWRSSPITLVAFAQRIRLDDRLSGDSQSADNYERSTHQDRWCGKDAEEHKVNDLEDYEQRCDIHPCDGCELYRGKIEGSTVKRKQYVAEQEETDPRRYGTDGAAQCER